jgi:toxin ParE1/3/4
LPSSKKLRISGPAKRDLERIGEYTRREWGAAQKRRYLGQIKDGFKAIRDAPGIGAQRDDIHEGLRAHPVRKHVIFYRVTKTELTIVRVLHESMSPELHN